jgi:hypothetical protein
MFTEHHFFLDNKDLICYHINMMKRGVMNMIEVGTKIVGNWGAGHSYSYGVVTDIYEFRGREQVVVDFDDIDVLTEFSENEFLFADSIDKIGVYVDHEGLVY